MSTRVSIVVLTLNGGDRLGALLDAVARQEHAFSLDLLAVDSGSTDGTRGLLADRGWRVIERDRPSFNHGATRNEALGVATGEFSVLLVQDAVPASSAWLGLLVAPLLADGTLAGTFARQEPWPGASQTTRHYHAGWAASGAVPRTVGPYSEAALLALSPEDRHRACAFDNVCSCIRMAAWRQHAFKSTTIAEDLEWARDVLLGGWRIGYVPSACVWHSHDRGAAYELRRTYLVHQRLQQLFGLSTVPSAASLVRSMASTLAVNTRLALREPAGRARALPRAAALALASPLGQYLGGRSAREGRSFMKVSGV